MSLLFFAGIGVGCVIGFLAGAAVLTFYFGLRFKKLSKGVADELDRVLRNFGLFSPEGGDR